MTKRTGQPRRGYLETSRICAILLAITSVTVAALGTTGCGSEPEAEDLTSLRRNGEVTFLCIDSEGNGTAMVDCPQGRRTRDNGLTVGKPLHNIYALITQTLSAEVAVVRVTGSDSRNYADGKVLDVDPASPGVTPLRVGAQPEGIVTTPGGKASFVTVAEPGREGVFGIPTSCMFAPKNGETRRDLTTWPACRLPSRPGKAVVLVDQDSKRSYCAAPPDASIARANADSECLTDLSEEKLSPGRRKLVVSLPEEGKLVVLDAQELLDRQRGSYEPCHIEAEVPLRSNIPTKLVQPLPPDLVSDETGFVREYPEIAGEYEPSPAGMDMLDDLLLVADRAGPLVHVLDAADPCDLSEQEPLVATSFSNPSRVVTTSRVAVSPLTQDSRRFVYALDEQGDELASVMVFDVSAGASSRLPLIREGSALISFEAPDRLEFSAAVKDVGFAKLDDPYIDPITGESVTGVHCNPDPGISQDAIEALYRPSSDEAGARPFQLRGLFGYALLSSGRLVVVDVEDFDADCRRPISVNVSSEPDFRGCQSDDNIAGFYTVDREESGSPTVTNEASCRVVVPHRPRSGLPIINEEGEAVQAPSLRGFARLTLRERGLSHSRATEEGKRRPILLGVDFEGPGGRAPEPAFVYVGSTKYSKDDPTEPLVLDPHVAERSAPVLPFIEPRAYPSDEVVSVSYEGDIDRERLTGRLTAPDAQGVMDLSDDSGHFCDRGVQGRRLATAVGEERFGLTSGALERFATRYGDYVQVTNVLFDEGDPYWQSAGQSCGDTGSTFSGESYALCASVFGGGEEDELNPARDFAIVNGFDDRLEIAPRFANRPQLAQDTAALLSCCFPGPIHYRVRAGHQWVVRGEASGFEHRVVASSAPDGSCALDRTPLTQYQQGRAFELASTTCESTDDADAGCSVGLWRAEDVVCAYDSNPGDDGSGAVRVGGPGSECIFDGLNRRFAIYRGLESSTRGMTFSFQVAGGFRGMVISLAGSSPAILPVSMTVVPDFGAMGVVDSQNQGLMLVDLPNSRVAARFF